MRLSLFVARRYLFSPKSHSVINLISGVSALTVAIPVMALVVLLSVFNGLDSLVRSLYRHFDPDIAVTPATGRFFSVDTLDTASIRALEGVAEIACTLEENALFEYRGRQQTGILKGVDTLFRRVVPIEEMVSVGEYALRFGDLDQALVGSGMAYNLQMNVALNEPLRIYVARHGRITPGLSLGMYRQQSLFPAGTFTLDSETDSRYVLVPLGFARRLLGRDERTVSAVIVGLKAGVDPDRARQQIAAVAGDRFRVLTRYQQKEDIYRLMQYEKWGIWFIILMVLLIASLGIVGSLIMIVIDKRKDTATLATLGADVPLIRRIFVNEGLLISGAGMVFGLILGVSVCLLQQRFGFVRMAGASFMVEAYPVEMRWADLAGIVVSVALIDYVIAKITVARMIRKNDNHRPSADRQSAGLAEAACEGGNYESK
jgi:lipoprotein-releasing system permease protein